MIVESLEFLSLLQTRQVGALLVFFVITLAYILILKVRSHQYREKTVNKYTPAQVTVVVPYFKEAPELLKRCLQSAKNQGIKSLITITDNLNDPAQEVAEAESTIHLVLSKRVGKRECLAEGFKRATTPFVVFLDSDTIMAEGTVKTMLNSMADDVAGVSTRHHIHPEDMQTVQGVYSEVIENTWHIVDTALSVAGQLIVLDGRCTMYRADAIRTYIASPEYINESVGKYKFVTGDDRQLTRHLIKTYWKTKVAATAIVYTSAPLSFKFFLKQQLRWMRSGYHYFFKDIQEGVFKKASSLYAFHSSMYFLMPFLFLAAVGYDLFNVSSLALPSFDVLAMIVVTLLGTTLIAYMRQAILTQKVAYSRFVLTGVIGLFALLPISLYALITKNKEHIWLTR